MEAAHAKRVGAHPVVVPALELAQPGARNSLPHSSHASRPAKPAGPPVFTSTSDDAIVAVARPLQVYNLTIRQFGALQSIAPNMHQMGYRWVGGSTRCAYALDGWHASATCVQWERMAGARPGAWVSLLPCPPPAETRPGASTAWAALRACIISLRRASTSSTRCMASMPWRCRRHLSRCVCDQSAGKRHG